MKKLIVILILIFSINSFADNILLHDGSVYINVKVLSQDENITKFQTDKDQQTLQAKLIKKIKSVIFNPNVKTKFYSISNISVKKPYPNLKFFPFVFICGFLAYDYFKDYGYYKDTYDQLEISKTVIRKIANKTTRENMLFEISQEQNEIKKIKQRKLITGIVMSCSAGYFLTYSLWKVEVKVGNKVELSFNL